MMRAEQCLIVQIGAVNRSAAIYPKFHRLEAEDNFLRDRGFALRAHRFARLWFWPEGWSTPLAWMVEDKPSEVPFTSFSSSLCFLLFSAVQPSGASLDHHLEM